MINSLIEWSFSRFISIIGNAMATAISGKFNAEVDSPKPNSEIIHAVIVVPTFAPIITAIAPASESKPAFTKLTTITVVADDDWIAAVTMVPVRMPRIDLSVIFARIRRILLPAIFCKLSLISFIPYKKMPNA